MHKLPDDDGILCAPRFFHFVAKESIHCLWYEQGLQEADSADNSCDNVCPRNVADTSTPEKSGAHWGPTE